jgi:hypothetical protein
VCDKPQTKVTTTKDELVRFLKEMYTMRRMEITNDTEYKVSKHRDKHRLKILLLLFA